ncbi:MAG: TIM barrel protein [Chitinophagaceae bacterium]|nr:TIM barrel protein [Chitinophagaceae bacterium]
MKTLLTVLLIVFYTASSFSQKITNDFFPLHNIIRGDSTYNTFYKQVALIKEAGYDAIEINNVESFEGMKAALDKNRFRASYFYVKLTLNAPYMDTRVKEYIHQLKGTQTIIAPFVLSNARFPVGSHLADTLVVRLVRQVADWAKEAGLQVAIYPHAGFYVERTDHALQLITDARKKNLGLTFNLCHWLATTTASERNGLKAHLKVLKPHLKMITICGANDVITTKANMWNDYILPLGTGSYDTYGLLKYCLNDLKLKVPVGVQCYDIKGDKYQLVYNTIKVWKQYREQMEQQNR